MSRTISYTLPGRYSDDVNYAALSVFLASESSPRVNGVLRFRANPFSLHTVITNATNHRGPGPAPSVYCNFVGTTNDPVISRARAIAQSDLRGQLARKVKNKNVGALGVSIASAGQSIEMMRNSSRRLIGVFEAAERFYRTTTGRKRLRRFRRLINRGAQPTAGMVLEGFFGWAPALEDFASAAKTLADPWPPSSWLSSGKEWQVSKQYLTKEDGPWQMSATTWSANGRESYSCNVSVTNPHLWVGNKLGLINPFSVAWDLVPWSFLVNMVSNMGQVMQSLTDFAGLSLSDTSMTYSIFMTEDAATNYRDPRPGAFSSASGNRWTKVRGREVGVNPPEVTPYLRFPEWNVGTAAILGSLVIQKAGMLGKVLGLNALTRGLD